MMSIIARRTTTRFVSLCKPRADDDDDDDDNNNRG